MCVHSNTDELQIPLNALVHGGWPAPGSVTGCVPGEKSLTTNYMDYTFDGMFVF
jgi:hypothetical protein